MSGNYSDDEVDEILRRALQGKAEGVGHDELAAAAAEIGIDSAALERAAAAVRDDREAKAMVELRRRRKRKSFLTHLLTYAVINGFLAVLDFLTGTGWWVQWPLLIWGLFVALDGVGVIAHDEAKELERARARIARNRAKQARRQKRSSGRRGQSTDLKTAEQQFERAVERGVTRLLETLARKIEQAAGEPVLADTDFGRYVAAKKHVPVRVEAETSPVRARVEPEGEPLRAEVDAVSTESRSTEK